MGSDGGRLWSCSSSFGVSTFFVFLEMCCTCKASLADLAVVRFDGRMMMAMNVKMVYTSESFVAHFANKRFDIGMDNEVSFEVCVTREYFWALMTLEY